MRRPLLVLLLLALAQLGACSQSLRSPTADGHPGASARPPASAVPSSPGSTRRGTIDAFVPEAMRFVESRRGLHFKQQVKVDHLTDQEFTQRIVTLQRRDRADTDRQARVYRALGLVAPDVDVEKAEEDLLGAGVIGYYDPKTKELVVRGEAATPAVKHVVVHELTHAVQDQWFQLDADQRDKSDDAALAYLALVEGDAVRVEREYLASLSVQERQQASQGGGGAPPPDVPRVLVEILSFPYALGPSFAEAVLKARGQEGLDRAFKERPSATSQILHPNRFLAGQQPQPVDEPPAEGAIFDRGVLGEAGLGVLLEELVRTRALSADQARAATQDWTGDRYVGWTRGDQSCVRIRFALSSAAAASALSTALEAVATTRLTMSIEAGSQPQLTSCG